MLVSLRSVAVAALVLFSASPAMAGTTHDVTVAPGGALVFSPADITISRGDTVRWTWAATGHNVGSGLPGAATAAFLSGPPAPSGTVFEVVFNSAFLTANPVAGGVYDYHCHPHGLDGMIGSVTISAASVPALPAWGALIMITMFLGGGALVLSKRRQLSAGPG